MTLLVDTHSHTVASTHAYSTVQEYVVQAKLKGMQMFSLTEHGPTMPDSPHPWHFGNRHVLPRVVDGIAILRAIEANIMPADGGHDIPNGLHPFLDFAIASFHEPVFAPASKAQNTKAMIATIETGDIQIIGHPGNPNFPIDIAEVVRAAKDNNVVLEVNNSSFKGSRSGSGPHCKKVLEITDQLDWKLVFSSDAHVAYDVGNDALSMACANEVGFPMHRIVNRDAHSFTTFLAQHNKPVAVELKDWLKAL